MKRSITLQFKVVVWLPLRVDFTLHSKVLPFIGCYWTLLLPGALHHCYGKWIHEILDKLEDGTIEIYVKNVDQWFTTIPLCLFSENVIGVRNKRIICVDLDHILSFPPNSTERYHVKKQKQKQKECTRLAKSTLFL